MDCAFGFVSKNLLPYQRPSRFSPTSSSRNLVVLQFKFRPVVHDELIFVKGMRSASRFCFFFFLHVDVHWLQHHLLKRFSLFHCLSFPLSRLSSLVKRHLTVLMAVCFWVLYAVPLTCLFFCQYLPVLITPALQ